VDVGLGPTQTKTLSAMDFKISATLDFLSPISLALPEKFKSKNVKRKPDFSPWA
jgi:hypothetical protein